MLQARTAEVAFAFVRVLVPLLVLMDVTLPGMDGLQATRVLKADPRTKAVPVVAVTALAMHGDEERIRAAGCDGYVSKPIRYRQFLQEVGNILKARSTNRP